jgi:hypothetical protein
MWQWNKTWADEKYKKDKLLVELKRAGHTPKNN